MRITNSLFYTNAANDYQNNMKELFKANTQISSGLKIQNGFEDSGVYVDTMRLNYEVATLEQVKESTSKAKTYANNTDQVLNQLTDALIQFKTKLIQAANESNSSTSLNALGNELQSLRDHMVSLGNTSINGQYLFSGTAVNTKPFNDDGTYNGNDDDIEAIIGSGVKLPYNINGQDLFLGSDSEYNKVLSTNVKILNQIALHPDSGNPEEIYIDENSTIRELVGDADNDVSNNGNAVFYLSGRRADGTTLSTHFSVSQTSKMSDLTERIGQEYGNTSTNKVVDVSINDHGQIEIKDLKSGNSLLEMNIFGAVDRNATGGTDGNANQTDIDDLLASTNVDIIEFIKSDFKTQNTANTISSREDINNPGIFRIGYPMSNSDGSSVEETTLLSEFMPFGVVDVDVNGTIIPMTDTIQDIMTAIETTQVPPLVAGSVRLENGQIIVDDSTSGLTATLIARDLGTNPALVGGFSAPDAMNYERRGFEKEGNFLSGNVSQIVIDSNDYATSKTKLSEVSGASLDTKSLELNYTDINDISNTASINFSTLGSTFTVNGNTYDIFNSKGQITSANDVTYQQLNDVISMILSDKLPTDGVPNIPLGSNPPNATIEFLEYNYAIETAANSVEMKLDSKGQLEIYDKKNSESKIEFSMFDLNADDITTPSSLSFMANDAITISQPKVNFFEDLDKTIEAVRSGTYNMDANSDDPRNIGIQNSIARLDHFIDHVTKEHTKIGSYSNALSQAGERSELLSINVQTIRSEVIDVDIGEAYMKFNQLANSYQAMLSTVSKINSMTLLNYM